MECTILLADANPKVRVGVGVLLAHRPGFRLLAAVADMAALTDRAAALQPDILLLDWGLPGLADGVALAALRQRCSGMQIIALSARPELAAAALASGVSAFVSKGDPPERLLLALDSLGASKDAARTCGTGKG